MTDEPNTAEGQAPGVGVVATLLLVSTLTIMAGATISPALPQLEAEFALLPNVKLLVGLVLTIPAAAIAVIAPLAGWLSDKTGRQRLLLASILLYAAAGTSGLWADGLPALLAGRILLGVAVGGVMATATALIGDLFQGEARARLFGWQAAATSFGGMVFLLAGGALADLSWRGPFAVYGVALLWLPLVLIFLKAAPALSKSDDEKLSQHGDKTHSLAVAGAAALTAFAGAAFYLVPTRLPFRLEEIGVPGGIWSGAAIGATVFASGFASLAASRLAKRLRPLLVVGLALACLGWGLAAIGLLDTFAGIVVALVVVGAGAGLAQPTLTGIALDAASGASRGRVAGLMASAVFAGQFASPLLSAPIESAADLASAYRLLGLVCGVAGVLLFIFAAARRDRTTKAVSL